MKNYKKEVTSTHSDVDTIFDYRLEKLSPSKVMNA